LSRLRLFDPASPTESYALSLHDALPIYRADRRRAGTQVGVAGQAAGGGRPGRARLRRLAALGVPPLSHEAEAPRGAGLRGQCLRFLRSRSRGCSWAVTSAVFFWASTRSQASPRPDRTRA